MKIIKLLLTILLATSLFIFVSFLNLKLLFSSADKAKSLFRESNLYSLVATGLRNNLSEQKDLPMDKGEFLEFSNEAITEDAVQSFSEDYIDQFYSIINTPGKKLAITLHFSSLRENVSQIMVKNNAQNTPEINKYLADREVDLSKNQFVVVLANLNKELLISLAASLVFAGLLLISGSWSSKFIWIGTGFILAGATFLTETLFYYFGVSEAMIKKVVEVSSLEDEKFVLAAKKLVLTVAESQRSFYLITTIIFIVLCTVFIVVSRLLKRKDVSSPIDDSNRLDAKPLK
jgi:hypothetical protein